jgi:hypothetical protein
MITLGVDIDLTGALAVFDMPTLPDGAKRRAAVNAPSSLASPEIAG